MTSTADILLHDYSTTIVDVSQATQAAERIGGASPPQRPDTSTVRDRPVQVTDLPWTVDTAWQAYLLRLAEEPIGGAVAAFWQRAQRATRGLPPPTALRSEDGSMHLAWDRHEHHLDVDLHADGTFEWFYRNRLTDELDGTDEERVASLLGALAARLRLLAA